MWCLYILECADGAYYIGITDDLRRRFSEHKSGKGGCYTKRNRPRAIIYSEKFETRAVAEKRERQIKGWSRAKKKALILGNLDVLCELSVSRVVQNAIEWVTRDLWFRSNHPEQVSTANASKG